MEKLFEILHEDEGLLVINKSAGLVCHPTKGDEFSSLAGRVRLYLGEHCSVHFVNRLDRETSGLVFVAKTNEVARELRRLWEDRKVTKTYWAIVHGRVPEDEGIVDVPIGSDESSEVAVKDCVRLDGAVAQTRFKVSWRFTRAADDFTWLHVEPMTGRKHQIRIHLQHLGYPIVGDKLYGHDESCYLKFAKGELTDAGWKKLILRNQALHAREVRFSWRERDWLFEAEPEDAFCDFIETFESAQSWQD